MARLFLAERTYARPRNLTTQDRHCGTGLPENCTVIFLPVDGSPPLPQHLGTTLLFCRALTHLHHVNLPTYLVHPSFLTLPKTPACLMLTHLDKGKKIETFPALLGLRQVTTTLCFRRSRPHSQERCHVCVKHESLCTTTNLCTQDCFGRFKRNERECEWSTGMSP